MKKLETLKKELWEKVTLDQTVGSFRRDDYDDLITHVYLQAIEDAKGALPNERHDTRDSSTDSAWNACRKEAITNLEALTKDV